MFWPLMFMFWFRAAAAAYFVVVGDGGGSVGNIVWPFIVEFGVVHAGGPGLYKHTLGDYDPPKASEWGARAGSSVFFNATYFPKLIRKRLELQVGLKMESFVDHNIC